MTKTLNIGFIGLGAIGHPVATNLVNSGYKLNLFKRPDQKSNLKTIRNASYYKSLAKIAELSEIIFLCLPNDNVVETILFKNNGLASNLKSERIIIDLSTINPEKAIEFANKLKLKNIYYVDSPVSGGTEGARNGTLTLFIGGNKKVMPDIRPILEVIGKNICYFGDSGKGQQVKVLNQILVATSFAGLAEAIKLGEAFNLPMEKVITALNQGAASSWALEHRSSAMLNKKYPLGFKLSLHHKDLEIALESSRKLNIDLIITTKIKEIEKRLIENGYGSEDISSLREYLS